MLVFIKLCSVNLSSHPFIFLPSCAGLRKDAEVAAAAGDLSGMCPREKRSLKPIFLISALQRRTIWILLARRAIKTLVIVNPLECLGWMLRWVKSSGHHTGLGNPRMQAIP